VGTILLISQGVAMKKFCTRVGYYEKWEHFISKFYEANLFTSFQYQLEQKTSQKKDRKKVLLLLWNCKSITSLLWILKTMYHVLGIELHMKRKFKECLKNVINPQQNICTW
jgi:hypothetical protein